ncbi:Gfo/Idh/MocA family protein [Streptomyces sp. NPDC092296]|uniref:Gfo/Idh/MocA family protein n=1 Tax=Streptomyces sp. NPDC092296 TaxID=3366012 RepID=UPI00380F0CDD
MPVAVIGLGDIAQKAYLPVLTAQPGLDLHLMTRDRAKLDRLGDAYRLPHRYTDLDAVIGAGVRAAFVHASTEQHVPIVSRLLAAGVDVYVDKPLDYRLSGARTLVELAESAGRSLMVGFNRRLAPGYAQALERPRELIVLRKNREGLPEDPRTVVFDDFIHVVDTLRFLVPGEIRHTDVRARVRDGKLHHVVLTLAGDGFTALGIMNRVSGSTEEILEVSGADSKREVRNLAEVVDHRGQPTVRRRGDWVPVARQRGIEQACLAFLGAVRAGRVVSARDALVTHELCEEIVGRVTG